MNEIKAIFVDFDWTLFDHHQHDYVCSGINALNKVKEKGIKVFINSARAYYSLRELNIFNMIDFDGFGCINGLYCLTKDKLLYAHYMNKNLLKKIINICETHHISYLITTLYETYIKDYHDHLTDDFYQTICEPYPKDISLYNQKEDIVAIQVYITEENEALFAQFKNQLRFNRWHPNVVEMNEISPLKSEATTALMKEFNLNKNQCMAIGDDTNDIDMFQKVKYSICMGNGHQDAKDSAFYVTTSIEDDGILNALKYFKVI